MPIRRRLITLSTLSGLLAQSDSPEDILPTAVEMVADVMEIEVVLIYTLDVDAGELVLSAYRGVSEEFVRGVNRMALGEGFNGRVAETGQTMVVSDAAQDPRLSREMVRRERLMGQLVVPMKSRGLVTGTICTATRSRREFDDAEIELMIAVANQIGIAIEEARLYQKQLRTTELLRRSEANYRELFENASDAIMINDMQGNIVEVNKACEKLLGYTAEELNGRSIFDFLRGNAVDLAREVGGRLLDGEIMGRRYEQRMIRRDGTEAIVEIATRLITTDGTHVGFHNIARDITDQRKMRDNLRFYLKQVLRAQEEERKRISRDLHDDAGQSLLLLIHRMDAIISAPGSKLPKSVQDGINELHSLAVEILDGLRKYAQQLRPAILDDMGLVAALEWMAENLRRERGIELNLEVSGPEYELQPEIRLVLFRIAQEALANIKRHSKATEAGIKLESNPDKTIMTISDNGKGFQPPLRLGDLASVGRLGLTGMEERAKLLGGTLYVQSNPGEGTIITVELPHLGT